MRSRNRAAFRREAVVSARASRVLACLVGLTFALPIVAADAQGPGFTLKYERNILSSKILGPVPEGFSSWRELFAQQQRLNAAATAIESDPAALAQLGGIIADPTERRLQVYWKGEMPDQTHTLLAKLRLNVPVDVIPSNYSAAELRLAAIRLVRDERVVRAHGGNDGNGLDVMLADNLPAAERARVLSELRDMRLLADGGAIPLSISYGQPTLPVHSRDASGSPVFAGSRIYQDFNSKACSLGFAVKLNADGAPGWFTAGHCWPKNYPSAIVRNGKAGKDERGSLAIGKYKKSSSDLDIAYVAAASGVAAGPFVYVGRPFGEDAAVPVGGSGKSFVGNFVFASGSATGLNGALKVEEIGVAYDQAIDLTLAVHTLAGGVAAAGSDSGGPVITFWPDGRVQANGVLLRHNSDFVTCPSQYQQAARGSCTHGVYYGETARGASALAVSVMVGDWP
jgi:hypothetical protein